MIKRILVVAVLATGLSACGEKAQTAQPAAKKSDGKAWDGAQNAYVAEGWKAGDQASWEGEPLTRLAELGQLMAFSHQGFWQPMDTLRDKNLLESLWDSGKAPWKAWS